MRLRCRICSGWLGNHRAEDHWAFHQLPVEERLRLTGSWGYTPTAMDAIQIVTEVAEWDWEVTKKALEAYEAQKAAGGQSDG